MKLFKLILTCSILALGLMIASCHKEDLQSRDISGLKPPPPPPPPPVDSSLVMFDPADSTAGWETVGAPVVVSAGQKQGTGYIQGMITPPNNFLQFIKTRIPPLDTKLTKENGELTFWWNIPDVTKLKADGQIQVSSSGGPDSKRFGWAIADLLPSLKNGWNQLTLSFATANVAGDGEPDLSAMNYFKIFFWTTDNVTANFACGIDAIQFKAHTVTTPPPTVGVEIDNCDSVGAWQTVGTPVIVTTGQKEGTGYLQGTLTTGNDFLQFIRPLAAPVDTKVTMSTGQLQFWFYVPDVTLLKLDGQIQFSSANDPDNKRIGWGLADIIPTLHNGWNQLKLNFRDAYVSGDGGPDLTAMNYFKMFFWASTPVTADQKFGLDDIKVVAIPPPPPVLISNCDSVSTWQTVGTPVIITTGQKEGAGYLQGTLTTGNEFLQFILPITTPVNTNVTIANGQLQFWFYVPDASLLDASVQVGQVQFSSANDPDKNRVGWGFDKIVPTLHNGWNLVSLNLSDGYVSGDGGPDLTKMNYFKMFFWTKSNATANINFGIDDIIVQQK